MTDRLPVIVFREAMGYRIASLFAVEARAEACGPTLANALARWRQGQLQRLGSPLDLDSHPSTIFARADLESHYVRGHYDVRGEQARPFRLFVVLQAHGEQQFVHVPRLALVFQRDPGRSLTDDVATGLARLVQRHRRDETDGDLPPMADGRSSIWLSWVELEVHDAHSKRDSDQQFAALFGMGVSSGAKELRETSSCLDELDPAQTSRCMGRDDLVALLERRFEARARRAVLLVGEPGAGKSAIVRELAMRRTERRQRGDKTRSRSSFWHLVPARLLAGMMYQGQWEQRLDAILRHAGKQDLVLWFDDLLGLTTAGRTSQTTLVMADLIKTAIDRGTCRIVGEITPGALRVLRERHRALASAFEIVRVPPADRDLTLRLILYTARTIERRFKVRFEPDLLRTLPEWVARSPAGQVEPGLSLRRLHRLVRGCPRRELAEASERSLGAWDLMHEHPLPHLGAPTAIREVLRQRVCGQPEATNTVASVALRAHLGLGDPRRPVQSLLFTGPTGVGKTESAKALAQALFRDATRHLLRFDMNQFSAYLQAQRLIGTFEAPDGLLTAAVRQTPAAVLLLDEIEKAHPMVHDLLLQVLGEGRLTDARGRTVDFRQTIIVMTSNLGAVRARDRIGIGDSPTAEVYETAVREFFRPELYNRIDRIVPFRPLPRQEIAGLVDNELDRAMNRHGLRRRSILIETTQKARDLLVDRGFHPHLGARALKRAITNHVIAQLAEPLVASREDRHVFTLFARDGQIAGDLCSPPASRLRVPELRELLAATDLRDLVDELSDRAAEVEQRLAERRRSGELAWDALETLSRLLVEPIGEGLAELRAPLDIDMWRARPRGVGDKSSRELKAAYHDTEIRDYLLRHLDRLPAARRQLERILARLLLAEEWCSQPWPGRALVHVRGRAAPVDAMVQNRAISVVRRLGEELELHPVVCEEQKFERPAWSLAGPLATALVTEGLLHAFARQCAGGVFDRVSRRWVELVVTPLADDEDAIAALARERRTHAAIIADVESGAANTGSLPLPELRLEIGYSEYGDETITFVPDTSRKPREIVTADDFVRWLLARASEVRE